MPASLAESGRKLNPRGLDRGRHARVDSVASPGDPAAREREAPTDHEAALATREERSFATQWDAVRSLLAEEVGWHEPGDEDHSGDYRGRDDVVALLEKLVAVTEGTFQLEPEAFLNLEAYSAVRVRWSAERQGRSSEGREIAVNRLLDGEIARVWFYNEPSEPEAFSAVFPFE
jgi:uncharacterized protein